jgi:hypothetical protein
MKNNISVAFLAVVLATVFSCKKSTDVPPIDTYSYLGGTVTISQLRAMYNGQNIKFMNDVSLYATVTLSDNYKTLALRDDGGTMMLKQLTAHGVFQGDYLRINLKNCWLDLSGTGGSLQLDSVDIGNSVVKIEVGRNPAPVPVSISQLLQSVTNHTYTSTNTIIQQSVYDGQLLQLNGVQFLVANVNDTGGLFLPPNNGVYINHTLTDCGSINTIVVSTYSNTPDLMQRKVPGGSGSLVAVASFYNGALQLTLRSYHEMQLNNPRCGADTLTQTFMLFGGGANFSSTVPGWFNINQVGYKTWTGTTANNLNFPVAASYQSGNPRNVMWLISPPIQSSPTKNLMFRTATGLYPASGQPVQISVLLSTDYKALANYQNNGYNTNLTTDQSVPANPSHWVDITSQFTTIQVGSSGTYIFSNANPSPVMLSQFLPANYTGTFNIAFRYTGNQVDSTTTYAIDNVIIKN